MKKTFPACVALFVTALLSQPLLAASDYLIDETDFLIAIPEVTSATRLSQKLSEAPVSISVIDRSMIEASGLQTLPDLLRLVPGFQSYLVSNNKFGVTYHGASDNFPNRLEVRVDGRSVYLPLLSTVDWTSLGINLEDVARIEVVRGSNTPTQGSNAFIGSINIITQEPTANSGVTLDTLIGSQQTRNAHLSYTGNSQDSLFSYRISASQERNDGNSHYSTFYTSPYFAADGSDGNWQDDIDRSYFNLSTTWTPSLKSSLWFQAGFDRGQETLGSLDVTNGTYAQRDHSSSFQNLKFTQLYSETGTLQLTAYHNRLNLNTANASVAEMSTILSTDFPLFLGMSTAAQQAFAQSLIDLNAYTSTAEDGITDTYDAELQLNDTLGELTYVTGFGYRLDQASSDVLFQAGDVQEASTRVFGNLSYNLSPVWQLTTGLMLEHSDDADAFSYRNALIFKTGHTGSLRLGYSRSERLPSILSQYANNALWLPPIPGYTTEPQLLDQVAVPNETLDPERISSWELGFYQLLPAPNSYFDLRLFHEQINDAIFSYFMSADDLDQRVLQRRNLGAWYNTGFEFQLKHQPLPSFWYLLNYAYINTVNKEWKRGPSKSLFSSDPSMTPEHTASLLLNWSLSPNLDLSLSHYYMSQVDWTEGGLRDAYQRTDVRLARRWNLSPQTSLETALIVQNAFEPSYAEFYSNNIFDRRTYLQLTLKCP